jgi:GntR family transcriptional repressor for pyruvate dehydrogenase complex
MPASHLIRMSSMQLPQNRPLSEQVCELIENEIIKGTFAVGDKLPTEQELSTQYRVSRTVIREATKILKEKGRLESFVGKGTFVVDRTERGIQSSLDAMLRMNPETSFNYLTEVRELLEPIVAALAALRASDEQIAEMEKAIALMDQSSEDHARQSEFLDSDSKFHTLLAEATGNPIIPMLIKPLGALIRQQQEFMAFEVVGGSVHSQKYHRLIFEAIRLRDAERARAHMEDHIRQVFQDIHDK